MTDDFIERINSGDPEARRQAIKSARRYDKRQLAAALESAINHENADVRVDVANEMGRLRLGELSLINHLLSDHSALVRRICAFYLTFPEYRRSKEALESALTDADDKVVETVINAVDVSSKTVQRSLKRLMTERCWSIRWEACSALVRAGVIDQEVINAAELITGAPEAVQHDDYVGRQRTIDEIPGIPPIGSSLITSAELLDLVRLGGHHDH